MHRSLGSHISKVRSLALDKWDASTVQYMAKIGNEAMNRVLEATPPQGAARPHPKSPREEREEWISAKYRDKAMMASCAAHSVDEVNEVRFIFFSPSFSLAALLLFSRVFLCPSVFSSCLTLEVPLNRLLPALRVTHCSLATRRTYPQCVQRNEWRHAGHCAVASLPRCQPIGGACGCCQAR